MLKADLHIHTCYSRDCCTPLDRIVAHCLEIGINCLAVADHNTIAGALKLREIAPFKIIVAQEIATPVGEIMGMFLTEEVPKGVTPEEAIARIRGQGGLVCIPHPFGRPPILSLRALRFRHCEQSVAISSRSGQAPQGNLLSHKILSQVDIVEAFNSRTPFSSNCARARRLAREYGKAASAGSDAHTLGEIGQAYVEMPEFNGPDDFLNCLAQGRIFGQRSSPLVHFNSTWAKIKKHFRGV